jgi:hypothetical protein
MTKVIILSEDTLDRYYDRTVQRLHDKFHTCPTNLSHGSRSDADAAQLSYYDAMARELARKSRRSRFYLQWLEGKHRSGGTGSSGSKPLGKIIF